MSNSNYMDSLSNDDQTVQNNNINKNPYASDQGSGKNFISTSSAGTNSNPSAYGASMYGDSSGDKKIINAADSSSPSSTYMNSTSDGLSLGKNSSSSSYGNNTIQNNSASNDANSTVTLPVESQSDSLYSAGTPSTSSTTFNNSSPSEAIMPNDLAHRATLSSNSSGNTIPSENISHFSKTHSSEKIKGGQTALSTELKAEKKHAEANTNFIPSNKVLVDPIPLSLAMVCLAFFLLLQNFAQACKKYCQTDSSLSNSIISGSSLAYLFSKGFPFMISMVNIAAPSIDNLYINHEGHLLVLALMSFGLGFLLNYSFEKKTACNIIEDIGQSAILYRINLSVLAIVFFFSGLFLINVSDINYIDLAQYGLFIGLMLCMETSTLCHLFTSRNEWLRRIILSAAVILGFSVGKQFDIAMMPLLFSTGFSFMLGFFVFTTMRIELATVKRNSCYPAFIISFVGVMALTLIQSLYESVRC